MFARLSNSWELVKASWRVLLADKELMVFPILSAIASILVMVTFIVPSIFAGALDSLAANGLGIAGYVVLFAFYVVSYSVTIFFNAALMGAAHIRLKGGDPTVGDGLRIAMSHFGSIVGYGLISATVGMVLRTVSERSGAFGRIVVSLVGFVWNVATFLVVPVLVVEGIGPVDAVKRSSSLLRQTWGEQLVGNFSIGTVFGLLSLVVVVLAVPVMILAAMTEVFVLLVVVAMVMVLALVGLGLISATLSGIYATAVYQYAVSGDTAGYFDPDLVKGAFSQK